MENRKWLEKVEFVASETNEGNNEPNKLVLHNGGNGDLYISICPASHRGSHTHFMRIERSGGASTRNPRVVALLTELYRELAGDGDPEAKSKSCENCEHLNNGDGND